MRRGLKLGCMQHSGGAREKFAHEEMKMSRIQPSCELHLGGGERDGDGHRKGPRKACTVALERAEGGLPGLMTLI